MRVNELIAELQKYDRNALVFIPNSKMDGGTGHIERLEDIPDGFSGSIIQLLPYNWKTTK